MASIKLILRTNKVDSSGNSPIYIRLIKDRKTKFIATGIKIKESDWDDNKQKVRKSYTNSARLNAFLAQKIADAEALVADSERKRSNISADRLKEVIKGKDASKFFEYAFQRLEKIKQNVSHRTYTTYTTYIKKFKTFVKNDDIYFDEITVTLLRDYVNYL